MYFATFKVGVNVTLLSLHSFELLFFSLSFFLAKKIRALSSFRGGDLKLSYNHFFFCRAPSTCAVSFSPYYHTIYKFSYGLAHSYCEELLVLEGYISTYSHLHHQGLFKTYKVRKCRRSCSSDNRSSSSINCLVVR